MFFLYLLVFLFVFLIGINGFIYFIGQSLKKIEKDTDRDYIMTPEEALEYGMIDKVVTKDSI